MEIQPNNSRVAGFGLQQRQDWYQDNIGRSISLTLAGGLVRGGIINRVDYTDGKVVLNPHMGKEYSCGSERDSLVSQDERVAIGAVVSERIHPRDHFESLLKVANPTPQIVPQWSK